MVTAGAFLAAFALYLSGAAPVFAPRDAADMSLAALTLGVAHPPGYPLYSVLGRAWIAALPFGDPAWRLSVLSALAGAGAVALLAGRAARRGGPLAGAAAALALALAAPLWKFSLLQEKYALHALCAAALLALAEGERSTFWRRARLAGLIAGLGLVNHQSLLLALPGFLWLWKDEARRHGATATEALKSALPWTAVGLGLYVFLWVRLGSLGEALSVALRLRYGAGTLAASLARPLDAAGLVRLAGWSLAECARAAGWASAALAVLALARRRASTGLLLVAASGPVFVLLSRFDHADWIARSVLEPAFLLPALVLASLAGEAAASYGPFAVLGLAAATLALPRPPNPERRDEFLARDYAVNLRRAVPPGAALVTAGDTALFGLRWMEATKPRTAALEVAGSEETDLSAWLAERRDKPIYAAGLGTERLDRLGLKTAAPQGVAVRINAEEAFAPIVLRRSRSWERRESYAADLRLSYAFSSWLSARLLERRRAPAGLVETLDMGAVALDPERFQLE